MISNFKGLSVLIVDDIRDVRTLTRSLLHTLGIDDVLEASDGKSALEILASYKRDLIITDLSMKPMNGIDLTRALRQPGVTLNPAIPVLVLSAHAEASYVEQALEAGVNEFLAKPLTRAGLQQKLEAMVERPRAVVRAPTYLGPDRRRRALRIRKRLRKSDQQGHTLI